jgi:hypothetical protein
MLYSRLSLCYVVMFAVLLSAYCSGCSSTGRLEAGNALVPADLVHEQLQQLPPVSELPARSASATLAIDAASPAEIAGAPAQSAGVTVGFYTTATAPAGGIEWVIYQSGPFNAANPPGQVVFNLAGSSGTVWLGIADFAQGAWDWQAIAEPFSGDMAITFSNPGQHYRESDGAAFIALLVFDGSSLKFASGFTGSLVPPELKAEFDFSLGPEDLPSGTTPAVNGLTLEIQAGSAQWSAATHTLSFNVRLNNVGEHTTSGCGGYDMLKDIGDANAHITRYDANGNPITPDLSDWPDDPVPPAESTDWSTWEFENPNDVHFDFSVEINWVAVHNLIAYNKWVDVGGDYISQLFLMQADGTGSAQATTFDYTPAFPGVDNGAMWPAWSPNRALLACISYEDLIVIDYNGDVTQLTFDGPPEYNATGGMIKTERPKAEPCWSPDGKKICFVRRYDPNETSYELCVINVDGSGFVRLTNDFNTSNETYEFPDHYPSWSPDGTSIVFERQGNWENDYDSDIWRINPDGSGMQDLTNTLDFEGNELYDGDPAWSPDGQRIVFVSEREWANDDPWYRPASLYMMNSSGGSVAQLTFTGGEDVSDYAPCWSPDGSKIVFIRLQSSVTRFCSINADGSGFKELLEFEDGGCPAW